MTFDELRQKHPKIHFKDFSFNQVGENLEIKFDFLLEPDVKFHPKLTVCYVQSSQISAIKPATLSNLVFHLGMIEIISYWKAACPSQIVISQEVVNKIPHLTQGQLDWWHELLIKGMGEFFFTNQIDFTQVDMVKFVAEAGVKNISGVSIESKPQVESPNYLIPLGGGKDSALTVGIFEKNSLPYSCLQLNPMSPAAEQILKISKPQQVIQVDRAIDPQLLELNKLGYLNGHTPFSAYLAFLGILVAEIFGFDQVVLSNERSANEGNIKFHDQTINHQYSKTLRFESRFREYIDQFIFGKPQPNYFSFLRPLFEIQIARMFAQFPQYHPIFRSCNQGQKQNIWCEKCPKCLFVFTMLFPFVDTNILTSQIFSHNLFENAFFEDLAMQLLGKTETKPFECVGTFEETLIAFYLCIQKYAQQKVELPAVLAKIDQNVLKNESKLKERAVKILSSYNGEHFIPSSLEKILLQEINASNS